MKWRYLARRLVGIILLSLSALFLLTSAYGFSVSKSATDYVTGTFILLISAALLVTSMWVLRVPLLRRIATKLQLLSSDPANIPNLGTQDTNPPAIEIEPLERLFSILESYPTYRFSDIQEKWLPNSGGVYVIYDIRGGALYVGRTGNLYRRIRLQHFSGERDYSSFRSLLMDKLRITKEDEVTNYLRTCKFRFILLPDENQQKDLEHYTKIRLKPFINN